MKLRNIMCSILFLILCFVFVPRITNYIKNLSYTESRYVLLGGDSIGIDVSIDSYNYVENNAAATKDMQSGTLTYIDFDTLEFGAFGHNVIDSNSKNNLDINIYESYVVDIDNSYYIGSKVVIPSNNVLGSVTHKSNNGVFGIYNGAIFNRSLIQIGTPMEIKKGVAYLYTVINDNVIEKFEINIIGINMFADQKQIKFKIIDKNILKETNGVILGMSGSPIVQNDKLIGAVSQVSVSEENVGYAIFITKMLEK